MEEHKVCGRCKTPKVLGEFNWKNKSKRVRQPFCRSCKKAYQDAWYKRHKVEQAGRVSRNRRERRKLNQKLVIDYLMIHPCVDCSETDIVVLEFDHVRGKKHRGISVLVETGASEKLLLKEIAKCDVRCANDHRRRTANTFGNYKLCARNSVGRAGAS